MKMGKIPEVDKHFIREYYLRKGYLVEFLSNGIGLKHRTLGIDVVVYYDNHDKDGIRGFIRSTDLFLLSQGK